MMQVLVLLVAPVAATAPAPDATSGTALQMDDESDVETADAIYVKENGDAVLAYNDTMSDSSGQFGVDMTTGLVHMLVTTETDSESMSGVSGQGNVVMTPSSIAGNGSLAMPQPDELSSFSMDATGVQNEKQAKMDATMSATIERQGTMGAFSSAHTEGHVTMTSDTFTTSGSASVSMPSPTGSESVLGYELESTDDGYVLTGERSGTVQYYAREDWDSRSAAKAHLQTQYADVAEQFGGEAQVTIDHYEYTESDGLGDLDVEYTVEYTGVKDAIARELADQLSQSEQVDLTDSAAQKVADDLKQVDVDHASFKMVQSGEEMTVSWDAKVDNFDDATSAMLTLVENMESQNLDQKQIDRAKKTLEARQSSDLTQKVTWMADLSSSGDRTATVDAEVHYETKNWQSYVNAVKKKGVTMGSLSFDVQAESAGDEVTADASFEVNQQQMLSTALDSATSSLDPTTNTQAMKFVEAFRNSDFQKAKMSVDATEGTMTIEGGAKFDNLSAMSEVFAEQYGGQTVTSIAGTANGDTSTTYVRVKGLVGTNATKEDVRALDVADEETEIHVDGNWSREFPSMDAKNVSGYLGVEYQSGDEGTNGTAKTTNPDGQPGFGVAVALVALVGAALLARRD